MPYIDTKYLFQCETCRNSLNGLCSSLYCDHGEMYVPLMSKIPTAKVEEIHEATWEVAGGCVEDGYVEMRCSHCHYTTVFTEENDVHIRCPHCGAYMNLMKRDL